MYLLTWKNVSPVMSQFFDTVHQLNDNETKHTNNLLSLLELHGCVR